MKELILTIFVNGFIVFMGERLFRGSNSIIFTEGQHRLILNQCFFALFDPFKFWLLRFCSFPFQFPHSPLSNKTFFFLPQVFKILLRFHCHWIYLGVLPSLIQITTTVSKLVSLQHVLFSSNTFTTPQLD